MLKSFAAALIAVSMLTAPVLAQGSTPAPVAPAHAVKAPAAKVVTIKTVKVKKHHRVKKQAVIHKHVKHVRHARHGHRHVRHVSVKRAHAVKVVRSAPKTGMN